MVIAVDCKSMLRLVGSNPINFNRFRRIMVVQKFAKFLVRVRFSSKPNLMSEWQTSRTQDTVFVGSNPTKIIKQVTEWFIVQILKICVLSTMGSNPILPCSQIIYTFFKINKKLIKFYIVNLKNIQIDTLFLK